jgi:hypothetical protein
MSDRMIKKKGPPEGLRTKQRFTLNLKLALVNRIALAFP